jgi:hypothetical protein
MNTRAYASFARCIVSYLSSAHALPRLALRSAVHGTGPTLGRGCSKVIPLWRRNHLADHPGSNTRSCVTDASAPSVLDVELPLLGFLRGRGRSPTLHRCVE